MTETTPRLVSRVLEAADAQLGADYAAVLYGSWVRGDVLDGRSDINLLLVAPRLVPGDLRALSGILREFEDQRMAPPLLFTETEWRRAGDSFPIEITDMKSACRVLRGTDPLAAIRVERSDLRRSLESELRGKLLRLRVDYGLYAAAPDLLATVVGYSIGSIRVLLRSVLVLGGAAIPATDEALADDAGRLCRFDAGQLKRLLAHRRHTAWHCEASLFEAYLGVVEQATHYVDTVQTGVH